MALDLETSDGVDLLDTYIKARCCGADRRSRGITFGLEAFFEASIWHHGALHSETCCLAALKSVIHDNTHYRSSIHTLEANSMLEWPQEIVSRPNRMLLISRHHGRLRYTG